MKTGLPKKYVGKSVDSIAAASREKKASARYGRQAFMYLIAER